MSYLDRDPRGEKRPYSSSLILLAGDAIAVPGVFALRMLAFSDRGNRSNTLYIAAPRTVQIIREKFLDNPERSIPCVSDSSGVGVLSMHVNLGSTEKVIFIGEEQGEKYKVSFANVKRSQAVVTISYVTISGLEITPLPKTVDIAGYMRGEKPSKFKKHLPSH